MNDTKGLTGAQHEAMKTTEQMIQEKRLKAPRVTPQDIEAAIASVHFVNAGVAAAHNNGGPTVVPPEPLRLLTLCLLVTTNGFTVVGKSACAHPDNYDEEIGRKVALDDAKRQLWPLLGYALRQHLHCGVPG